LAFATNRFLLVKYDGAVSLALEKACGSQAGRASADDAHWIIGAFARGCRRLLERERNGKKTSEKRSHLVQSDPTKTKEI
jgi:hypothetical protein